MVREKKFLARLYLCEVFPNMIAILGGTINVFFDGILVGQKLGDIGIASVNQSLAVYLMLCTIGSLIAAGASAESAAAMGAKRTREAQQYFSVALELALIAGVCFCGIGLLASHSIAGFLGSADSMELVETYIRITFIGGIFKILLYLPFFYLRLIGRTVYSAVAMLTMTVLNIVLDYVFLFVCNWGIAGAAWASVFATVVACLLSYAFLFVKQSEFRFQPVPLSKSMVMTIVKRGSPMAANNLFSALRIVCLNSIMNLAGGSRMVAIFAITNSINEFSISIQNGVPQAGSAMLGICYGEKDSESIRQLLKLQLKLGVVFSVIFGLAVICFRGGIGVWFGADLNVGPALIGLAISLVPGTCNSIMTYYYYAVMRSGMANLITVLRVFAVTVLVAWILVPTGGFIWVFYPLGEILTMLLYGAAGLWLGRREGKRDLYLLGEDLTEDQCINFTVSCNVEDICGASAKISEFCERAAFSEEQNMTISLALEELMIIVADKSMNNQGMLDVRIVRTQEGGILRIRSHGKHYNPFEFAQGDMEYMGVDLIMNMAKSTEYQTTLGLNTLTVVL